MASTFLFLTLFMCGPADTIDLISPDWIMEHSEEIIKWAHEEQLAYYDASFDYFFRDKVFARENLKSLHRTYWHMMEYPRLEEINPKFYLNKHTTRHLMNFNRACMAHLENRMRWESDRRDILQKGIDECLVYWEIWNLIDNLAQNETGQFTYGPAMRRQNYKNLLKRLEAAGIDPFADELPPYVPEWIFNKGR